MSTNRDTSNSNELDDRLMHSFHSAQSNDDGFNTEGLHAETAENLPHDCDSDGVVLSAAMNLHDDALLDTCT